MGTEVEKGRPHSALGLRLCQFTAEQQGHEQRFDPLGHVPARISTRGKCPAGEPPCLVFCAGPAEGASRAPSPLPSRQGGRVENCPVAALQPRSCAPLPSGRRQGLGTMQTSGQLCAQPLRPSQHARQLKGSRLSLHGRQEVACNGDFQHSA